jgi:hypothetical protein
MIGLTRGQTKQKGVRKESTLIAICMYCHKYLGIRGDEPGITHGMCDKCQKKKQKEMEKMKNEDNKKTVC